MAPEERVPWSQLALGLVLTAIAGVGLRRVWIDPFLHEDFGADPGPALFPLILLVLLGVGGVLQVGLAMARARRSGGFAGDPAFRSSLLAVPALLVVTLLAYVFALPRIGYLWASFAFGIIWLLVIERGRAWRASRALRCIVEAALITAALYGLFRYGIRVPLT